MNHRRLAAELQLFHIPSSSPGMPAWHPRGTRVYNRLVDIWRTLSDEAGYEEVRTPLVAARPLWDASGHWDKGGDRLMRLDVDGVASALKPVNCPGHADVFNAVPRSWRDLPMRLSECGHVHRAEQAGELQSCLRVRAFCQDDAHLFCRPDGVVDELDGCLDLALRTYRLFGLDASAELSLRPESRLGDDRLWDEAEAGLRAALERAGVPYRETPGEGAFYGPKIDLHARDARGRAWQLGSIQLDYLLASRMGCSYVAEDGRRETPVVIHRAVFGSFERFLGILIDVDDGWLPPWLSPEPVRILPLGAVDVEALVGELARRGVRASVVADGPLAARIADSHRWRVPYLIVVGEREAAAGTLSIRDRHGMSRTLAAEEALDELESVCSWRLADGSGRLDG